MTETAKCECYLDIEGYHKCESCENGTTNEVDFLSYYDTILNDELDTYEEREY